MLSETITLTREVRFYSGAVSARITNSWSGTGDCVEGGYLAVRAGVTGEIGEPTGYLCNIKDIDNLLRTAAVPRLALGATTLRQQAARLLELFPVLADELCQSHMKESASLAFLSLRLSPLLNLTVFHGESGMVHLTQSYEFSAAHRLYCHALSDEENRRIFGKCANDNGHGHNYVFDVTIAGEVGETTGTLIPVSHLDDIVSHEIIARFDHRHLNLDCEDFRNLNPSVENIARVIFNHLETPLKPTRLVSVKVWETGKTSAEYRG